MSMERRRIPHAQTVTWDGQHRSVSALAGCQALSVCEKSSLARNHAENAPVGVRKVNRGASAIREASTTSRNSTTSAALQSAAVPELQSTNAVPHPKSVIVERCSQLGGL